MSELMQAILELNRIDRRIVRGKLRLQEVTRSVAAREKAVEDARIKARGIEQSIKDKAFGADKINLEVGAAEAEAAEQERKLKNIKNQREFRIVTDRIKDLKIRVDECESQLLANMTDIDALREQVAAAHTLVGEEDLKLTTAKQKAQEEIEEIKAKHAALLEERKDAVAQVEKLDGSAYHTYDLALKRTKGDPIAAMSADGICQSCFLRQNTNVSNMVTIGIDVKSCKCQGCGRILYVKPGDDDSE